jgi:C4-dicarboxylate-specific signal transduction histidine kinase
MDHADALRALQSEVPSERLEAARYLQFWAMPTDIARLRATIQRESVGWVRRALEGALTRLGDDTNQRVNFDELAAENYDEIDAGGVARTRIARTVVHELGPIAATIDYFANAEWDDYRGSKTQANVNRLGRFIKAIDKLGSISGSPHLRRIELSRVIARCVEAEQVAHDQIIEIDGPRSLTSTTDPDLVELILSNAMKNACEAVALPEVSLPKVSIVFGGTDRDVWINVVDNGVGLPLGTSGQLFAIGSTTKEGHLGMGLALAAEAAKSIGARVNLSSSSAGAKFELLIPTSEVRSATPSH